MSEALNTALSLLAIGMLTVFIVLLLVVLTGNTLIRVVNRFFPEAQRQLEKTISKSKLAAISAAVDIFTEGHGRVTKVEKEN